jgi:hypothetical protein
MIEAYLRAITGEFSDIVKSIEKLEISEEEQISNLKAKLILFDGTIFWVREVWLRETIEAYSYYWLRPDDTVIIGWDNAPHHREVSSFPHHRHVGNKIESSEERDLRNVLSFIRDFFG